ncbi:hypothetical protein TrVFT333_006779 [Trichoderma virens FT-333]|nr:hypothetical protein TrVFT333_006779 [Trichoderma virens FT-333]
MSQEYFNDKGKAPAIRDSDDADLESAGPAGGRPNYMTVGNGTTSEHAARLQSMLDIDSGYGGSIMGDEPGVWDMQGHGHQRQSGAIHQLWYNSQRATLGRSINKVLDLLHGLREMNSVWPAHYPSVQRAEKMESDVPRPGILHSSTMEDITARSSQAPPPMLRRAMTSLEDASAESSQASETRPEPRLVSPQIAQEFSVLKLDLKLGALHQAELVHSLEKGSIASLLDGKISSSIKHLVSLRERIEDKSSKVLITGDLNAGKSTFCNALLRRKVLPEDQQPCTAIFCEVLDARENAGIEEVHAVHKEMIYNRNDESTYDAYSLQELERIVIDNEKYVQCKVYVKDVRTIDESLLNNGVVDIALIDAPGLNSDTTKTTAIFARQEEIDVVVFVVSAANHFTQSAKEFIWAAAAEKAYIFIVVNGYDFIRDKERCQKMILDQQCHPNGTLTPGGPSGGGGSGSGSGGGDDPSDDGKGKDSDKVRDFEKLEQSLRRFVLEKRARSKLAPARTYLLNILNDVNTLATVNHEVAQSEFDRVTQELKELEPQILASKKARSEVDEQVVHNIEETCKDIYDHTRGQLNAAITYAGNTKYDIPYPGLFGAFGYADDLKDAILSHIADAVNDCEDYARASTVKGVNAIKQLGLLHVGDEFQNLHFRPDVMFRRKKDALARQVDVPTEFADFVDFSTLMHSQEKFAGTGMALTIAGAVVPRMLGMNSWVDHAITATRIIGNENLRKLILPGIVVAAIAASAYVLQQIPNSLPHRLARKIEAQLAEIDYVHTNASRISGSVRTVLRMPADNLRVGLDHSVKDLNKKRDETVKVKGESERASKFFRKLVGESQVQKNMVEGVDLDTPPQNLH